MIHSQSIQNHASTDILTKAGLKQTQSRKSLLSLMLSARKPLTHQELSGKLSEIDRVTIYRMLNQFEQKGVVHRIDSGDRIWRFAVCSHGHKDHCHPHFSCKECGKTECLSDVPLPRWEKIKQGYLVENQEVYIHGLCADCSSSSKKGAK